jgi:hypothetical protein
MGKVKSQSIRRYEGTCLMDMISQKLPQRGLKEMGGRMIEGRCFSPIQIHPKGCLYSFLHHPPFHSPLMDDEVLYRPESILNLNGKILMEDQASIAHLTPCLSIEVFL